MGIALLHALREDQIGEVKLSYVGFVDDWFEVAFLKRSMAPVLLYRIEGEAKDVGLRVTMTKILLDPFMLKPLNAQIREWIKKFAHFLINC